GYTVGTTVTATIQDATDLTVSSGTTQVYIKHNGVIDTVTGTISGTTITFNYNSPAFPVGHCQTSQVAYDPRPTDNQNGHGNEPANDYIDDGILNQSAASGAGFAFLDENGNPNPCSDTCIDPLLSITAASHDVAGSSAGSANNTGTSSEGVVDPDANLVI